MYRSPKRHCGERKQLAREVVDGLNITPAMYTFSERLGTGLPPPKISGPTDFCVLRTSVAKFLKKCFRSTNQIFLDFLHIASFTIPLYFPKGNISGIPYTDFIYKYVSRYSIFKSTVLHQFLELGGLSMRGCIGLKRRMQQGSLQPRSTTFIFLHITL